MPLQLDDPYTIGYPYVVRLAGKQAIEIRLWLNNSDLQGNWKQYIDMVMFENLNDAVAFQMAWQ